MMIVIRIQLHLKLLVCLHQRVYILHRVLHMYVVVARAVDNQHIACQVFRTRQQRRLVVTTITVVKAVFILFFSSHFTFITNLSQYNNPSSNITIVILYLNIIFFSNPLYGLIWIQRMIWKVYFSQIVWLYFFI